jgi:hypothetical protein
VIEEVAVAKVAVCGTFDVENYGDCLFPVVAASRLSEAGHSVLSVSPTSRTTRWNDSQPPIAVSSLVDHRPNACLIGGGNIIHNHGGGLQDYREEGVSATAYASLWAGVTMYSVVQEIPVAWNSPGVPSRFNARDAKYVVSPYLEAADYLAVRDTASRDFLGQHHVRPVDVVPDTAVEISNAWSKPSLEPVFRDILDRQSAPRADRYFSVHIKQRAIGADEHNILSGIERLSKQLDATPILLALAPCHHDDAAVRAISTKLTIPHIALDDARSLKEIASAIAMAGAYVGPSLHGYITSYSYDVPSALVARPKLEKFLGFMRHVEREHDVVPDWDTAFSTIEARFGKPFRTEKVDQYLKDALDKHWSRIINIIAQGPTEPSQVRLDKILRPLIRKEEDLAFNPRTYVKKILKRAGLK